MKRTRKVAHLVFVMLLGLCFTSPFVHADTVYVTAGDGIEEFNSSGGTGSVFSAGGWGAMAISTSDNLYAAGQNNTIYKFNSAGNASLFANTGLSVPFGLTFDSSSNLYAANLGNNTIQKFNASGTGSVLATSTSGVDSPEGLAVGKNGDLYVANGGDDTILEFNSSGTATVFATFRSVQPHRSRV